MASVLMIELSDMGSKIAALSSDVAKAESRAEMLQELKPDDSMAIAAAKAHYKLKYDELTALEKEWTKLKARVSEKGRDAMDVIQPKLPAVDRPSYNGDPELLKPFQREAQEFLDVFEGRLTESGKLKQVRQMLTGEAKRWLTTAEEDGSPFQTCDELLSALKESFGAFDEQEVLLTELMVMSPSRVGGTLVEYVRTFRRKFNLLEKENVPSFTATKAMFLLSLSKSTLRELRPRLIGIRTVPALFHMASQLGEASVGEDDPMDLDAARFDGKSASSKGDGNKDGKVKKSRAPPSVVCHQCTGRGHFAHECPSAKKWKGSEAKNE